MKTKILLFISLLFLVIFSWGCGKANYDNSQPPKENEAEQVNLYEVNERKIIYYINTNLKVNNLDNAIEAIHNAKKVDEWYENENIHPTYAEITIRIKSNRIDEFKEVLKQIGELSNYTLTSTDISLEYAGTKEAIASYEAELSRLLELYDDATVNEIIEINRRIREINTELSRLNRKQNEFDSLIEYSSVRLYINGPEQKSKTKFGSMSKSAFFGGIDAFITFFQFIILAIIAVFPFAVIIVPTIILIKRHKDKKKKIDL